MPDSVQPQDADVERHETDPDSKAESGLSSVDNALLLLQLVGERKLIRVADAADELGVARSTAHRLLKALRQRGFVDQDRPNGAYRPGRALNEIGLAAIGRIDIRRVARPALERLRSATQETVSLLILEGNEVRFVDCVESMRSVRVSSRTGLVLPAHCTAGGKAILAALSPVELDRRYPDKNLISRTPNTVTDWSELERELVDIRADGYALNIEEGEPGVSAIGTAIHDIVGAPIAAIAVAVPGNRMASIEEGRLLAPPLLATRAEIADLLRAEL